MTTSIIQIIIGIILAIIAIKIFKKVTKGIILILILAGIYSFANGLVNLGVLMEWWQSLPAMFGG